MNSKSHERSKIASAYPENTTLYKKIYIQAKTGIIDKGVFRRTPVALDIFPVWYEHQY